MLRIDLLEYTESIITDQGQESVFQSDIASQLRLLSVLHNITFFDKA